MIRFWLALQFLTRLPTPSTAHLTPEAVQASLRASLPLFPLVGALVGALSAAVLWAAGQVWALPVAVLLALMVEALVTGAFHEDAVADFCDAIGGGHTRARKLDILKDSRIGSFGALGLLLAVGLRVALLISLPLHLAVPALLASATLGRWLILLVMALVPPAAAGLGKDIGGQATWRDVWRGAMWALPGVAWLLVTNPGGLLLGVMACAGFALWLRGRLMAWLGGVTGDGLGFACYAGQLLILLAVAA